MPTAVSTSPAPVLEKYVHVPETKHDRESDVDFEIEAQHVLIDEILNTSRLGRSRHVGSLAI